jgi:serine protease Do
MLAVRHVKSIMICALAAAAPVYGQTQPAPGALDPKQPDALHEFSASLQSLAHRAGRAVVQIFSSGYALRDEEEGSSSASLLTRQRSTGSGIILSADGYIVTNAHVVRAGQRLQVQLSSPAESTPGHSLLRPAGKKITAKVVGVDRETDLAVLKIDAPNLAHLTLGDSDELRQGQIVLAFGSPLGLANSVTMGVVSSTVRQLKPDDPVVYIQTDAPINPGNSGGPLLDTDGRVVGINTLILTQSGGSEGVGFAIPSNVVKNVYTQIRKDGHVHRGQIGVYAQTISPAFAAGLGLPQEYGVVIGDVAPDGPADKAGLQVGDVILRLDGKPMENARQLEVNIYRRSLNEKVSLDVMRGHDALTVEVPVIERKDDPQRFADMVNPDSNVVARLGILGIPIDRKVAAMLPDLRKTYGVVVAASMFGSQGGLKPGDVIYALNGSPISSVDALRSALSAIKPGDAAVLQIERDGRLMFLEVELE